MKKYLNVLNIYTLVWCILNLRIITNSTISVLCLAILLLVSIYYMSKVLLLPKPRVLSVLFVFLLLLSVYGFAFIISGEQIYMSAGEGRYIKNREFILLIYQSILPIFPFYYFSVKKKLTKDLMQKWLYVFFVVILFIFIRNYYNELATLDANQDGITNNAGYDFLSLLPLVALCNKNKLLQHICFYVCVFFIILSVKRGAIIIGLIAYLWFLLNSAGETWFSKLKMIFLICLSSFILLKLFAYLLETNEYFLYRLEETMEGHSSGRFRLFNTLVNAYFNESTFLQQLFGRGAYGTLKITDNVAHNDWLELLIDLGLIGLISYFVYWISLIVTWLRARLNKEIYLPLGLFVIIFFIKTFFSMSFNDMTIYSTMVLGYCLANISIKHGSYLHHKDKGY